MQSHTILHSWGSYCLVFAVNAIFIIYSKPFPLICRLEDMELRRKILHGSYSNCFDSPPTYWFSQLILTDCYATRQAVWQPQCKSEITKLSTKIRHWSTSQQFPPEKTKQQFAWLLRLRPQNKSKGNFCVAKQFYVLKTLEVWISTLHFKQSEAKKQVENCSERSIRSCLSVYVQ